ncbi:hypothetical protein [Desulfitobacterium sp.]|nr:hypothetical protein [Desulfitobacterium sp.]MEA4902385.1 hypothetical protein [Desulfitobacterium sp.]
MPFQSSQIPGMSELNDPGIIGMVRKEQDENFLLFDAAVRYPVIE